MRHVTTLVIASAIALSIPACSCESRSAHPRDTGTGDRDGAISTPGHDTGTNVPVDANRPDTGFAVCDGRDYDA